jgi:toxin ParE1/3/4
VKRAIVSREAEADIDQITEYTTKAWGSLQTDRYLDQLEDSFQILAEHPFIGRSCEELQSGLRRYESGRHVVFYRVLRDGIRVVRVLHQQMIPIKPQFES